MKVTLTLNGQEAAVEVPPWRRLLDVLRDDLSLTGTKEGCGEGECGACTVLLDGEPVNSCLVAAGQCDGRAVTTVEGLATHRRGEEILHAVQRQLVACGGAQCGICTPGIAVCAAHLLERGLGAPGDGANDGASDGAGVGAQAALPLAGKSEAEARAAVRELLAGNICRCTGYQLVVEAVLAAAREVADGDAGATGRPS
ncbi:MAG: (2Fe-2S)-binding protein [Myxococcales bacterium]|nr:(2Fe-2S)-binding protein [Myxococcales bacterium]